jgi:hypothetical protein
LTSLNSPLLAFRSSPEFSTLAPLPLVPSRALFRQLPSLRFLPLRRFPSCGQSLTSRGYHFPGYVAFSAFLTLSRPFSTHCLPALFHAGPALGVSPSGSLTPRRGQLSRAFLPSCGCFLFGLPLQVHCFRRAT